MPIGICKSVWIISLFLIGGGCCEIDSSLPSVIVDLNMPSDQSTDDLLNLTDAIGVDFQQRAEYVTVLKHELRMKHIRLINVDYGQNTLVNGKLHAPRLTAGLEWCRRIGAAPHIVIGQGIPIWLSTYNNQRLYGPSDWDAYRAYIYRILYYVIVTEGFSSATWEVANEPDIDYAPYPQYPRSQAFGKEDDYRAYFKLYRTIAEVAEQFEQDYPGSSVPLGGPVTTIFSFGRASWVSFNWHERFLADVAKRDVKLDFFVFHFYGNGSGIRNRPAMNSIYPPFEEIMQQTKTWIEKYKPGLPIWLSEWGPSYHTNMTPAGIINGNYVGAAWSAAFIHTMLQSGVQKAFLLNTNDISDDNWGWPSLLHNTQRKPIYHVLKMFRSLSGQLFRSDDNIKSVDAIAAKQGETIRVIVWNFYWLRSEFNGGFERSKETKLNLNIRGLEAGGLYKIETTMIAEDAGNPIAGIHLLDPSRNVRITQACTEGLNLAVTLPPSSVMLLTFSPTNFGADNP